MIGVNKLRSIRITVRKQGAIRIHAVLRRRPYGHWEHFIF